MSENSYKGIEMQSKYEEDIKFVGNIEEKILDKAFYKMYKEKIRFVYKRKNLQEKTRIKRTIYNSSYSRTKKDEIWVYLNQLTEDEL